MPQPTHSADHSAASHEESSSPTSYAGSIHFAHRIPVIHDTNALATARPRLVHLRVNTFHILHGDVKMDEDEEILPFTPGSPNKMHGYSRAPSPAPCHHDQVFHSRREEDGQSPVTPWTAVVTPVLHGFDCDLTRAPEPELWTRAAVLHEEEVAVDEGMLVDVKDNGTFGQFRDSSHHDAAGARLLQLAGVAARARRASG